MEINQPKLFNQLYLIREKLVDGVLYLISFRHVRLYLIFIFALNAVNWFLAYYVNQNVSQNLVVLHYNVNLGVNLIGEVSDIYVIPTLGLAFIVINFLLLLNIYRQTKFLSHLILGSSFIINLLLIAGTIAVYLINFR